MGMTRAQSNRQVRQEALREQLAQGQHIHHVLEMVEKLRDLDTEIEPNNVNRLRIAIETKLKLVNKYLADTKHVELTGDLELKAVELDYQGFHEDDSPDTEA